MGMFDSLKNVFGGKQQATQDVTVSPSKMLRDAGIDPGGIKFGFGSDGSISMSGEIADESQREQIVAILSAAPGISRINDSTTVAAPEPAEAEVTEVEAVEIETPVAVETETPAEAPAAEAGPEENNGKTYTVESGDTLWKISEEVYGNGSNYMKIFEANKDLLDSPDRIFPGQELVIPELED